MADLGFFQGLLACCVSKERFAQIEAETRTWTATCPKCSGKFDSWDVGAIIWKKTYDTKSLIKCPHCHKRSMITISQKSE